MSIIEPLIGVAGSILQNQIQNKQSKENIEHAAKINYGYGEMAADSADARTRALYSSLYSPEAKVKQLKNAGLSVGLMYGQGGAGGTSSTAGAQGQGAGGQQAKQPLGILQSAELGLMAAQAKKLNAEADNLNAGTNKLGAETDVLKQQVDLYVEKIKETKAVTRLRNSEADIADVQAEISTYTRIDQINQIKERLNETRISIKKFEHENNILIQQNKLNDIQLEVAEKTKKAQIDAFNQSVKESIAKTAMYGSQEKLNKEEANLIANKIQEINSSIEYRKADIATRNKMIEAGIKNTEEISTAMKWGAVASILNGLIDLGSQFIPSNTITDVITTSKKTKGGTITETETQTHNKGKSFK